MAADHDVVLYEKMCQASKRGKLNSAERNRITNIVIGSKDIRDTARTN